MLSLVWGGWLQNHSTPSVWSTAVFTVLRKYEITHPFFFMFMINFGELDFLRYKGWGRFHPNQGEARLYMWGMSVTGVSPFYPNADLVSLLYRLQFILHRRGIRFSLATLLYTPSIWLWVETASGCYIFQDEDACLHSPCSDDCTDEPMIWG